jgi:hypothetical protein
MTQRWWLIVLGYVAVVFSPGVVVAEPVPVKFDTALPDSYGVVRDVSFDGALNGTALTGQLTFAGSNMVLSAEITAGGILTGDLTLLESGVPIGGFAGRMEAGVISGTYLIGDHSGSWSVPANLLGAAAAH